MPVVPQNKYALKSLHEEIDFFDRKLAHLLKYDTFPTEAARDAAAGKISSKRDQLVKSARKLAADGIEFHPSDLPRSLRPAGEPEQPLESKPDVAEVTPAAEVPAETSTQLGAVKSHLFGKEIQEYLSKRRR